MKTISKILVPALFTMFFCSCDEPASAAFVYGNISIGPGDTARFHGTLSNSGSADVYGTCKVSNGVLNFTVGHAPEADIDNVVGINAPTFLSIAGVVGPNGGPVQGVFDLSNPNTDDPQPKNDDDLYSTFDRVQVKNHIDAWTFQTPNDTVCRVQLFAEPIDGEIIFEEELNKEFDYYVKLFCSGLADIEGKNGTALNTLSAELYFENCS